MLRRAFLCVAYLAFSNLACSSSDFEVGGGSPEDSSSTSDSESDSQAAGDGVVEDTTPVDTKPDPCAPDPSKAKFCITVAPEGEHGPYDSADGLAYQIDGKGRVYIFVYDKDPLESKSAVPIATIPYPPDSEVGAEVAIGTDFPLTIAGTVAKPGEYTVVALFADSKKPRTTGAGGIIPGDFVSLPTVSGMKLSYPKMTLNIGKTANITSPVRAVRGVTMTLTASPGLRDKGPTVHGDGPVLFALTTDPEIAGTTKWTHFETGGCVDLDIDAVAPRPQDITFNTVAVGSFSVFAAVFDYSATDPGFPGAGTLVSQQSGAVPKVEVRKENWSAKVKVPLVGIAFDAVPAGTVDTLTCPAPTL